MLIRLAKVVTSLSALILAAACDASPVAPSPKPVPDTQVVVQPIEVRTSDGRTLGNITITAVAGQELTITAQDLITRGVSMETVDQRYFALREVDEGPVLGKLVVISRQGALHFIPSAASRVLWAMSSLNGADYVATGSQAFGSNVFARYLTVRRLTNANNTYPDLRPLEGGTADVEAGLAMLNDIWRVGGVRLAQMTWVGDAPTADFRGGLARLLTMPAAGFHGQGYFSADPQYGPIVTRNVTIAEAIESLHTFNDLFGLPTTRTLFGVFYDGARMTDVGRDYVRSMALMARDNRDVF